MMGTANKAKIWAVIGSSGCGKGLWMKEQLRKLKPKRLIILDTKDENGDFAELAPTLRDVALATFKPAFKVRYIPKGRSKNDRQAEFEELCRMASAAKNCTFVVEELGRYTMPSYAPPAWSDCCNDGRHDGLHIIAASQFPAQIDKAFLGNCTLIHTGFLQTVPHRKCVAEMMDIDPDEIKALADFEYLEFVRSERKTTRGRVRNPYA